MQTGPVLVKVEHPRKQLDCTSMSHKAKYSPWRVALSHLQAMSPNYDVALASSASQGLYD